MDNICWCECHLERDMVCEECKENSCSATKIVNGLWWVPNPIERDLNKRLKLLEEGLRSVWIQCNDCVEQLNIPRDKND